MDNKLQEKRFIYGALFTTALVLVVVYFSQVLQGVKKLWGIAFPLLLGFIIAYVINILMAFFEKHYFTKSKRPWVEKTKRPVCLLLALLLIMLVVALVINLVLPQVIDTFKMLGETFPIYFDTIDQWITQRQSQWPTVAQWFSESNLDWDSIAESVMTYATQGLGGLVSSSVNLIAALASMVFNWLVGLAFAIYLLLGKATLLAQAKRLGQAFISPKTTSKLSEVLAVAHESFSSFIIGQCTEAVILGALCVVGMWILQIPYATTVGIFVGVTSLVPIFGAYLGAGVGVLLILAVEPFKALLFIVFILVLQQLEGDLIYPKVVGTSIGLPGIWVFAAVVVGGGLAGVVGMLFGVPVAATVYKLLRMVTNSRLQNQAPPHAADGEGQAAQG